MLTLWGKSKGVTSEQEVEKMDRQESTATTQCRGEAAAQIGGLDSTGPLGSMVARVTTLNKRHEDQHYHLHTKQPTSYRLPSASRACLVPKLAVSSSGSKSVLISFQIALSVSILELESAKSKH